MCHKLALTVLYVPCSIDSGPAGPRLASKMLDGKRHTYGSTLVRDRRLPPTCCSECISEAEIDASKQRSSWPPPCSVRSCSPCLVGASLIWNEIACDCQPSHPPLDRLRSERSHRVQCREGEREKERLRKKEREGERGRGRKREQERKCVCVRAREKGTGRVREGGSEEKRERRREREREKASF